MPTTNELLMSGILAEEDEEQRQPSPERKTALINKVSKFVVVPKEEPFVFEITELQIEYFKDNEEYPLLKDVKLGDIVLVFADEGKLLVYRESEDKVISYGIEESINELIEVELS
jgi:hypothetical protein